MAAKNVVAKVNDDDKLRLDFVTQNNEYKEILGFQHWVLGIGPPGADPRSGRIVSYFYVGTEKTGRGAELCVFLLLFVCF